MSYKDNLIYRQEFNSSTPVSGYKNSASQSLDEDRNVLLTVAAEQSELGEPDGWNDPPYEFHQYYQEPDTSMLSGHDIGTVSFWIKPGYDLGADMPHRPGLLTLKSYVHSNGNMYPLFWISSGWAGPNVGQALFTVESRIEGGDYRGTNKIDSYTDSSGVVHTNLAANEWYHVALVWNENPAEDPQFDNQYGRIPRYDFYINGVLQPFHYDSGGWGNAHMLVDSNEVIAGAAPRNSSYGPSYWYALNGMMDDIRLYSVELDSSEIQEVMTEYETVIAGRATRLRMISK